MSVKMLHANYSSKVTPKANSCASIKHAGHKPWNCCYKRELIQIFVCQS